MKKWNHNIHYHKNILSNLSYGKSIALDIGSGDGDFGEKLSNYYGKVVCLEPDVESYEYAKNKYLLNNKITHENKNLDEYYSTEKYDFITCIASIHHMDFRKSLIKIKKLLKNNGKLIILGLYKENSLVDYFYTLIAFLPNKIRCLMIKKEKKDDFKLKIMPANMTYLEIEKVSNEILRKYKIKRHLYWRYSIIYKNEEN